MKVSKIFKFGLFAILLISLCFLDDSIFHDHSQHTHEQSQPQQPSLLNMLKVSQMPIGHTLYVWGGGWNEEDTGAGPEAEEIGIPSTWDAFMNSQTTGYSHLNSLYQIHDGLDCSGYIGWTLYNTLEDENNQEGYVVEAADTGDFLSAKGWGSVLDPSSDQWFSPGDILYSDSHVYICLGRYDDGSVLFVHTAPPGTEVAGTPTPDGNTASQAASEAARIMSTYYPTFYNTFGPTAVDTSYLWNYNDFHWNTSLFPDALQVQQMSVEDIVEALYPSAATENETENTQ